MVDLYTQMVRATVISLEARLTVILAIPADPNEANGAGSRRFVQGQAYPRFLSLGYRSGE
jgi:hypothetical protein